MSIITTPIKSNLIINGDFRIAQRGTSFAAIANTNYTVDRWNYGKAGDMVHAISQDTDVPTLAQSGITSQYSLKVDCTTVDSSIAATDFTAIRHYVEGYNIATYIGRNLTLSFWVKATKTGVYCVTLFNSGADRRFTSEYTVNTTNTWEKKSILIPLNYSGGTWDYTTGSGLKIWFMLACGSDYQTSIINTWQTSSTALATANQVNATDSTDNNFWLANVKLEAGSVATKYEPRLFAEELQLCKRYYQKSYELSVAPATDTLIGYIYVSHNTVDTAGVTDFSGILWQSEMRAAPNVTIYNKVGTAGYSSDASGNYINNSVANNIGSKGFRYLSTDASSAGNNSVRGFHYIAVAEL